MSCEAGPARRRCRARDSGVDGGLHLGRHLRVGVPKVTERRRPRSRPPRRTGSPPRGRRRRSRLERLGLGRELGALGLELLRAGVDARLTSRQLVLHLGQRARLLGLPALLVELRLRRLELGEPLGDRRLALRELLLALAQPGRARVDAGLRRERVVDAADAVDRPDLREERRDGCALGVGERLAVDGREDDAAGSPTVPSNSAASCSVTLLVGVPGIEIAEEIVPAKARR